MIQISIFDMIREPIRITKPIRLIELFAGYGSQAMALKRIGAKFEHYRVVEFDKYAIASYNAVHGTSFPTMDITKVHAEDLNICDTEVFTYLLTYSFPCTDLSVAGKQAGMKKGSGTRSGLLWEVERILKEIRDGGGELPQILFMENVPQVHANANMEDFQNWIDFLTSLGYVSYWQDLNAKNYGVAQNRERCFMFSFLGEYNYHNMTELEPRQDNISNTMTTVQKDNLLLENNIQKVGQISSDGSQRGTVISDNGISANLVAGTHGYANSHIATKYRIRKLTPRECGRLMGVSDEDISKMAAVNSNTQLYKQFGNSIVVDVMCAMFRNLNIEQEVK